MEPEQLLRFSYENQITQREQEILMHMIFNGLSNKEIAEFMIISEKTVKNHISNLYCKCGVSNFRQLIALIISQTTPGIIQRSDPHTKSS